MTLQPNQYNCIGIVATHCDQNKLCIAQNEASDFDLAELFCDFWTDIEAMNDEVIAYQNAPIPKPAEPTNLALKLELLNGGFYTDCAGKKRPFEGVYSILARYSYSRYVILNGFNDTATGMKNKTNEFSIPVPLKELENFADKYRNMGKISFERTVRFLCKNKEVFDYNKCPKEGCNCGCEKCGETKAKGYGLRSNNIKK